MTQSMLGTHPVQSFSVRRITLPTDFSDPSRNAVEWAILVARQFGARLHLLHVLPETVAAPAVNPVIPSGHIPPPAPSPQELLEAIEPRMTEMMTRCLELAVPAESQVVHPVGEPVYRPIVDAAIANGSDLIVVGTHGRSGLKRFLLGSVAEGVMRHSPIPVLAVPWAANA
ncbi:MAG TPA: universal stress protein [Polyangiaceae bacterium]|nr:universal stress protein [Polyangiaceae bacterium]